MFAILLGVVSIVDQAMCSQPYDFIKCGACKMIIDEVENEIKSTNSTEEVEVGSYRVDPDGNQYLNKVPYARSDVHVHELLDKVCDKTALYGTMKHPVTRKDLVLHMARVGESQARAIVDTSSDIKSKLRFQCDEILENYEDNIVKFLKKEYKDPAEMYCHRERRICEKDEFIPLPKVEPPQPELKNEL